MTSIFYGLHETPMTESLESMTPESTSFPLRLSFVASSGGLRNYVPPPAIDFLPRRRLPSGGRLDPQHLGIDLNAVKPRATSVLGMLGRVLLCRLPAPPSR